MRMRTRLGFASWAASGRATRRKATTSITERNSVIVRISFTFCQDESTRGKRQSKRRHVLPNGRERFPFLWPAMSALDKGRSQSHLLGAFGRLYNSPRSRRGAGAADRAGLENRCGRKSTEGSNPSLSACLLADES